MISLLRFFVAEKFQPQISLFHPTAMNLILIRADEVNGHQVCLTDRRADHLRKILKVKLGDTVRVGIIDGEMGIGTVNDISRHAVVLTVETNTPPPKKLDLDLILALPRPIMLKRVLAQIAALGVNHLFLVNANRVEKSFFEASPTREGDFLPYLYNGLEQAIDTIAPTVSVHQRFKPFIEDILPGVAASRRIIAHPNGAASLAEEFGVSSHQERTLLAIGPEGGWIDYELSRFGDCGFYPFSLGPRILRVDTAVPAIIAQIALLQQKNTQRIA